MSGATDNGAMGNNRGAGPATSGSPVSPAKQASEETQRPSAVLHWLRFDKIATEEVTRRAWCPIALPSMEDNGGLMADIDSTFRHKIASLKRLPHRERAAALRAACDERAIAMRALKEKSAAARQRRKAMLQQMAPAPRG